MKLKSLIVLALCSVMPALACAKKPKVVTPEETAPQAVVEEEPVITEECLANVSLFSEYVKSKQFADAYGPWLEVYTTCPNANKAIYTNGAKILDWKYDNAADEAEKEQIRQMAIGLHDKRIRFFGNDPKYPTNYILGQKGIDYCKYYPEDPTPAYEWLKTSVMDQKAQSQIQVLVKFFEVSYVVYRSNPSQYAEQFITDYTTASGFLGEIAANPINKNAAAAAQNSDRINDLFAQSGAADCDKLDELYAQTVQDHLGDLETLGKVIKLYKRVNCTESAVYFAAAAASHKLQPTEESAAGCARMCAKKEDWRGAIEYFQQAINLDLEAQDEDLDEAEYTYRIALIYMNNLKNYSEARTYARKSIEFAGSDVTKQSRCYILIGMCYAASHPYSSNDMPAAKAAILNKTVYWAAVDKFQKAKAIDPSCAADADKLISAYAKYFPTKEEMFDLPNELGGATFTVGGWIGETTVCRGR